MKHYLGRVIYHIHLRVSDIEASRRFYRAACHALRLGHTFVDGGEYFSFDEVYVDAATDYVSRIHFAFQARTHDDVRRFYSDTIEAGGRPNGEPDFRPYHDQYFAAFVLDPDGNNIEAVCDAPTHRSAAVISVERGP